MKRLSGSHISIDLDTSNNSHQWTFTPIKGDPLIVTNPRLRNLEKERENLRQTLESFRGYFPNEVKRFEDWSKISRAVNLLEDIGHGLGNTLFGYQGWGDIKALFQRTRLLQRSEKDGPFLVEVLTPLVGMIPIEFLPVFDKRRNSSSIKNAMDLEAAMRRFLAFSALVRRVIRHDSTYERDNIIDASPKFPLKFFYNAGLEGALKEKSFFEKRPQVELRGPWPNEDLTVDQVVETLADHLLNPAKKFRSLSACSPDQIQHFACHCDTSEASALEHYLTLAHAPAADRKIRIGALRSKIGRRAGLMPKKKEETSPLIFLNACGSNTMTPMESTSFLELFLNIGRGMIGTEALVPDKFAAAFSELFYRRLIKHHALGESIHQARLDMLRRYNIPLGILYTLYADTDIRVGYRNGKD